MKRPITSGLILALAMLAALPPPSEAGCRRRARRCRPACLAATASAQAAHRVAVAPASAPQAPIAGAAGFVAWLNVERARSGLGPVGYDPSLAGWAAANNAQQVAIGLGHHVRGPARRQNSGMGDLSAVASGWMASGAHQSALLDPTITAVGIAGSGGYWTYSAY